jgi:hypothetical protein
MSFHRYVALHATISFDARHGSVIVLEVRSRPARQYILLHSLSSLFIITHLSSFSQLSLDFSFSFNMSAISTTTTASAPLNSAFAHRTPSSTIGDQASSSGLTATPPAQWVSATQVVPESDTAFTGLGETLTQGTSAASNGIIEIPWSGENGEPESKRSEEEYVLPQP